MDKRIKYLIGIDTETCNTLEQPFPYDIGWTVTDKRANIYVERSFVVYEFFFGMRDIMQSAYYADKLPQYFEDIRAGRRTVATLATIRRIFQQDCKEWNVSAVFAYNTRFDLLAMNDAIRYTTKSAQRYFFPYGAELWDVMKMVQDTIAKQPSYIAFCEKHGFMTKHKKPRPQITAEVVTRYLRGNADFIESHTGLEDVHIEAQILAHCFRQHKKMRKLLFND